MQSFAREVITRAALSAGMPEGSVIDIVKKDNLTIRRPRLELQFMPERYTRTGRKLAVTRTTTEQIRKRELYEVELTVNANVLADNRTWLEAFCVAFVPTLPRGGNDSRGNWVKIRVQEATFGREADTRVGDSVIRVFNRMNRLFVVEFVWRVTSEEAEALIPTISITPKIYKE